MSGPHRETPKIDRARRKARPQEWVAKPKVGDTLGSFRLLQLLGEGGAGAVYRAEHSFLKRPVAIKILHPELYLRPAMVARFFQEALAVNRARHRNIIDITDVVATENYPPFIVMELLEGEDLGDYIDYHAPLGLRFTVDIARQICDALAVVHKLEIVHRDLKPENIFLARESEDASAIPTVKLLDFGIAKFIDSEENRRRTWSGNILGTPAYMPLEQLHGLPVDRRADIYALGVVLYEMLTRHLPFEIDGLEDLADGALTRTPPPPSVRVGKAAPEPIPAEVDAVVMRCLADSPAKRFQTVKELSEALAEAASPPGASGEAAPAAAPSGRRRSGRGSGRLRPVWPEPSASESGDSASSVEEAIHRQVTVAAPTAEAALPRIPTPPEPSDASGEHDARSASSEPSGSVDLAALTTSEEPEVTARVERPRSSIAAVAIRLVALALLAGALWVTWSIWKASATDSGQGSARTERRAPPRPGAQSITLESEPPGARIHQADSGVLLGQTPTRVPVTEGHPEELVLRKAGYQEARVTLRVGGPNPARITLDPEPARPPPPPRIDAGVVAPPPRNHEGPPDMRPSGPAPPGPRRPTPRAPARPMVTEQGIVDPLPM